MGESCGVFVWKGTKGRGGCETDRTKRIVINSITQTIPMNPLGRESCSAEASTIPGFPLHCAKSESTGLLFYVAPILLCWLCPSGCSMFKKVVGLLLWGITCIFKKNENSVKKSSDIKMNEN